MDDKIPFFPGKLSPMEFTPKTKARMEKDEEEKKLRVKWLEVFQELENAPLPCRFFAPEAEKGKKYPFVLFLHGAGERGSDNCAQLTANDGANVWVREQQENAGEKCFVLAPQCPESDGEIRWNDSHCLGLMELIDRLEKQYPIDDSRLYVAGLSMGGSGTVDMLRLNRGRFAAAVVMCPALITGKPMTETKPDPEQISQAAATVQKLPIWIFHAEDDMAVPVETSRLLVSEIEALGRTRSDSHRYTEYPKSEGWNHGCWTPALENSEMRSWLFRQKLQV